MVENSLMFYGYLFLANWNVNKIKIAYFHTGNIFKLSGSNRE